MYAWLRPSLGKCVSLVLAYYVQRVFGREFGARVSLMYGGWLIGMQSSDVLVTRISIAHTPQSFKTPSTSVSGALSRSFVSRQLRTHGEERAQDLGTVKQWRRIETTTWTFTKDNSGEVARRVVNVGKLGIYSCSSIHRKPNLTSCVHDTRTRRYCGFAKTKLSKTDFGKVAQSFEPAADDIGPQIELNTDDTLKI
jgi:hypothetical protein